MFTREEIEKCEEQKLAPYAMKSRNSRGRKYPQPEHPYRTIFQRDRDRIIHCTAFRRLEYKTQVFVNHEGDYYRTRLTHTIEVAQIARTIARALNLNEDLAEVVSLGHDLGHTPFGHSGEEALHELMKDDGGFEHNSQGVRVVELLERRYPDFSGLNLSWEVRESMRKHHTLYDKPAKHDYDPHLQPLLEAQIVDAADTIAYDNHDLDDSLIAKLITETDLQKVEFWNEAVNATKKKYPSASRGITITQSIVYLINSQVSDLLENTQKRLKDFDIKDTAGVRECKEKIACFSGELLRKKSELEKFLYKSVYRHHRVVTMSEKAKRFIKELFSAYVSHPEQLPPKWQLRAEQDGVKRAVCDYIAGMTDRFAQDEYKRLFHPFENLI